MWCMHVFVYAVYDTRLIFDCAASGYTDSCLKGIVHNSLPVEATYMYCIHDMQVMLSDDVRLVAC